MFSGRASSLSVNSNKGGELIPTEPFEGKHMTEEGGMTWAIQWVQGIENPISDSM
ncbi:MAG: hypothetical protein Ct9H300mP3_00710 [Gammaproteobacteria bacterium]|nr:MAG: hypothetical protein Ct9H300mP3_00710 [Gammaproteobacteria bacterium]